MALTAANSTAEPRSFSLGPLKIQIVNYSIANGDTSGTITFDALSSVSQVVIHGMALTAAPTYATNVVTLAFVDPTATRYGMAVAYGR